MDHYDQYFRTGNLILKFLRGELTEEEGIELNRWIAQSKHNKDLFEKLTREDFIYNELEVYHSNDKKEAWERLSHKSGFPARGKKTFRVKVLLKYAAVVILFIASSAVIYRLIRDNQSEAQNTVVSTDLAPGVNKAVLVLDNGREVLLDSLTVGEIARQGNVRITQHGDGQLEYHILASETRKETKSRQGNTVYNHIKIPRGGQFRIALADGSIVWLNSASSLKYPVSFNGGERNVELSGEAYFEIKSLPGKPAFKVVSKGQVVEVLGTHFNVNSYSDERYITTTLLEGSVKISSDQQAIMLKPGEQAQLSPKDKLPIKIIPDADMKEAIAWKNGQFQFKDAGLETIMRQVSRWYDVEVVYPDPLPGLKFRGKISRDVPLSKLLQILEASGINFKTEGRKIIIGS